VSALDTWPADEWVADCLKWRGVVLTGSKAHWCNDWDGLPIDETCAEEFDRCTCYNQSKEDQVAKLEAKNAVNWSRACIVNIAEAMETSCQYVSHAQDAREVAQHLANVKAAQECIASIGKIRDAFEESIYEAAAMMLSGMVVEEAKASQAIANDLAAILLRIEKRKRASRDASWHFALPDDADPTVAR